MSGFFESDVSAKTGKRHSFLYAVRKQLGKVMPLVRERVLPWCKGEGKKMGNTSVILYVHLKNDAFPIFSPLPYVKVPTSLSLSTMSFPFSLFSNYEQKAIMFSCIGWDVGLKKPRPILHILSKIGNERTLGR